jgi:osmotically inducible lipoprotein OsmB
MRHLTLGLVLAASLSACNSYNPAERALVGGVVGAGTGAIIGGASTGQPGGALVGAAIGGVGGAALGAATTPRRAY